MAMQSTTHSAQVVGSVFVNQYYHNLNGSPDQVHKFYKDASTIGWAGSDGVMEYATTLPEINKKIMSMDFSKYLTKIDNADAVLSINGSALVVVTGSFTSVSDDVCQRFTQTFLLAPQESGGYFVLNDILRFLSESNQEDGENHKDEPAALSDTTPAAVEEPLTTDPVVNVACGEPLNPTVDSTTVENNPTVNGTTVENNVKSPVEVTKGDVKKTPVAASPPPAQKDIPKKHPVTASPAPPAQKDAVKKTYASIVKDNKEVSPAVKPKIAKPVSKPPPKVVEESAKPPQAAETTPASTSAIKSNSPHDEQGFSVFVRGLPSRSTVKMVGEDFKKFGAIKAGGIQVRNNKFDEFCFGFVEFESQQSMQAAIEASPIFIAEKEVIIEKKRTTTRVVNGVVMNGGRFQYARGAQNFRGQGGGYANDANYRRWENDGGYRHQNEFSGHGRGSPHGNGYHQNGNGFHQKGSEKYVRVNNGPKEAPVAARVNNGPKEAPAAARVNNIPKEPAPVNAGPKQTPVAEK
ncbi:hypothetical protein QYE76_066303 [Lolium multiflorum]|uniref:Uncharacterized protein n=1 Tax=Lolium multiflorum TaxID=4521 RepID=A0AAD8W9S1_LOLMU|nr:hypothetical protein QYE76_066303 [Lolium multiflorum]